MDHNEIRKLAFMSALEFARLHPEMYKATDVIAAATEFEVYLQSPYSLAPVAGAAADNIQFP